MNKTQKAKFDKDPEGFVNKLIAEHKEALAKKDEAHAAEIEELKEAHANEIASLQKEAAKELNVVPGTFKADDGTKYRFKKGFVKTRTQKHGIVDSSELISNADYREEMEHLIEVGYGGLEVVESK